MISRAKTLLNERSGGRRVESSRYTHNRIFNATLNTMKSNGLSNGLQTYSNQK